MSELVGREAEFEAIARFLNCAIGGPSAILLSGEVGIGKTSLLDTTVARARTEGFEVLGCRPTPSEGALSFAGLSDLVARVGREAFDSLPAPQRRALDVALMLEDPRGPPPSQLAISLAFSSLVASLEARRPVLIAIDDVQSLDAATIEVLAFLVRRLSDERVGLIIVTPIDGDPLLLDRSFQEVRRIELGPLRLDELFHLLHTRTGHTFPRPTLVKIRHTSRGNPFFALEIARAIVQSTARLGPADDVPVPTSLQRLVEERLAGMPESTLKVLAFAAAAEDCTISLLGRAVGRSTDEVIADLAPAIGSGITRIRSDVVTFDHPLLATAAWTRSGDAQSSIYRALATATDDPESKARFIARARPGPNAVVAATLEAGASRAASRGARFAAAELWQLAVDLTPINQADEARRRRMELAGALFLLGQTDDAAKLMDKVAGSMRPGPDRARVWLRLAKLRHEQRNAQEAATYCDMALAEAGDDRHLRIEIEVCAAYVTDFDMEGRAAHARTALEMITLDDSSDTSITAQACTASTLAELCLGNGLRRDLLDRAVDLERVNPPALVSLRATTNLGEFLLRCDDSAGARPLIERSLGAARETDESSLCEAILCAAQLELVTGDWSRADLLLRECLDVAEWTGQPLKSLQSLCFLAPLHAATGRSDAADLEIESTRRLAADLDNTNATLLATIAEGTVAFHRGDNPLAASALALADAEDERQHMREPGFRRYLGDLIEALLAMGRWAEASDVIARLGQMAVRLDRRSALASAARGRALLEAEEGDVRAAIASCGEARTQHARMDAPFELARTLLVEASLRRRMRQKTAARALFDEAEGIFRCLDAVPWAERARQGSARIGGGAGAGASLTPTERRVAELVATGMKNRDVAAALFMSPRSVEANLTKVYRKLGVSRATIGATLETSREAVPSSARSVRKSAATPDYAAKHTT